MLENVLRTIDDRKDAAVSALAEFLRIPSVSTAPEHAADLRRCATWLADQLKAGGMRVHIHETGGGQGHPLVLAKNEHTPGRPTVLFYGHYDVQPAEPLEKWTSGAFEPTVRDGGAGRAIYARGAADDKGQVWAHCEAVLAWQAHGGLPVNLTMLIEGEEEIGSEHLETWVEQNKVELRADVAVVSDTNQFAPGLPALTCALRGITYMEVFLTGPGHDLHSGQFGGSVPNPANVLCRLIGSLHDADGKVNIPGFYDDVKPVPEMERDAWRRLPFDERQNLEELQLSDGTGEKGYTTLERRWARPTLDVHGLTSGYQGEGGKTIIPSVASAKISMRLVPDQYPAKVAEAFERALRERCPANVKIEFANHGLAGPVVVPADSEAMRLAAEAVTEGFGTAPALIREGGSIPVVAMFQRVLKLDTLLVGFGLPDDRVHSPNEKFDLDALHKGARTSAVLYEKLSRLPASS